MLFNSLAYLLFFPLAVGAYYLAPERLRLPVLLLFSAYFYMAFVPVFILVLACTILIDWTSGLLLERLPQQHRKYALGASLVANLGVLSAFKYWNFVADNLEGLLGLLGHAEGLPRWNIALPLGLSFHTFQSIAYTIEVYRRRYPAERNPLVLAAYVLFFPQLVAGPIERPQHLLPQLRTRRFDPDLAIRGLRLMLLGMVKKAVIADRLGAFVDIVYARPEAYAGAPVLVAAMAFAGQIYCDFSGYTDLARGSAAVMGFELRENFARPFLARSLAELWRRWHLSLTSWFRDYVYVTLGGNRVPEARRRANVLAVFLLSGLWHGANWTFVVWGGLNAILVMTSPTPDPRAPAARCVLQTATTFLLFALLFVYFRAESLDHASQILGALLAPAEAWTTWRGPGVPRAWLLFAGLLVCEAIAERRGDDLFSRFPRWARWALYYGAIALIAFGGVWQRRQFIYFQF